MGAKSYWVGYNDGRDEQRFRSVLDYSAIAAAARYADQEYCEGRIQSEYELVVKLGRDQWEATVETRVEFDVFMGPT